MSMTKDWACLIQRLWWVSTVPLVRLANICSRLRQTRQMDRTHQLRLQMGRPSRPCSSEMVHSNRKRWATNLYLVMSTKKHEKVKITLWFWNLWVKQSWPIQMCFELCLFYENDFQVREIKVIKIMTGYFYLYSYTHVSTTYTPFALLITAKLPNTTSVPH